MSDWNTQIIEEFRANAGKVGGQFEGAPLLLLHTTGAKSGKARVNPMMYLTDGDNFACLHRRPVHPRTPTGITTCWPIRELPSRSVTRPSTWSPVAEATIAIDCGHARRSFTGLRRLRGKDHARFRSSSRTHEVTTATVDAPTVEAIRTSPRPARRPGRHNPDPAPGGRCGGAAVGASTEVWLKEELFQRTGSFKPRRAR